MPLGQFLRDSPIKLDHETKSDQTAWRSTALLLLYIRIQYLNPPQKSWVFMSNPLDSRKTKLLKTKTAEFSILEQTFLVKLFQKRKPKQQYYTY